MWDDDKITEFTGEVGALSSPGLNQYVSLEENKNQNMNKRTPADAQSCSSEDALGDFESAFEMQKDFL